MFPFTFNNALRFLPAATGTQTRKTPSVEKLLMLALFIGFMFSSMSSMAGAGGTEFTQVYARESGQRVPPSQGAVPVTKEARAQQGMSPL